LHLPAPNFERNPSDNVVEIVEWFEEGIVMEGGVLVMEGGVLRYWLCFYEVWSDEE
jgi:hypothetical protein